MRVVSIRDVLRMDKGDTVDAVKGEIKTIYKSQQVGKRGGTLQTIVLTDGRDEIKAKLWDREEDIPSSWKGRFIHIVASGDRDRDALTVDEYKNDIQLNVPKTAEITKGTDMGDDGGDDRKRDRDERGGREDRKDDRREDRRENRGRDEPDDRREREPEREPKKVDLEDPKVASRNVTLAKLNAARNANLYKVALMASDHVAEWWKDKHGQDVSMPLELYKAMAHGFYMDLRAADHDERMPVHDITEYLVSKPKRKEKSDKSEKTQQEAEGGAA